MAKATKTAKKKTATQAPKTVGLMGLGLMGRGIATCLLLHGRQVVAYNRTASRAKAARKSIAEFIDEAVSRGACTKTAARGWDKRLTITHEVADLKDCPFIIESVKEDLELKRSLFTQLEQAVSAKCVIASNTSSFPVTVLQHGRKNPERYLVVHWAEPAWITRFLEIVRSDKTAPRAHKLALALGEALGKEPSLVKFDIRGFVANRLMYAFMREACHLVDIGAADIETVDRSFRNDVGTWATIAGPFRWMDLTGLGAYATVMEGLLPELCNSGELPEVMKKAVRKKAEGLTTCQGHYKYTKAQAHKWEKAWTDFNYDIQKLVDEYSKRVGGL